MPKMTLNPHLKTGSVVVHRGQNFTLHSKMEGPTGNGSKGVYMLFTSDCPECGKSFGQVCTPFHRLKKTCGAADCRKASRHKGGKRKIEDYVGGKLAWDGSPLEIGTNVDILVKGVKRGEARVKAVNTVVGSTEKNRGKVFDIYSFYVVCQCGEIMETTYAATPTSTKWARLFCLGCVPKQRKSVEEPKKSVEDIEIPIKGKKESWQGEVARDNTPRVAVRDDEFTLPTSLPTGVGVGTTTSEQPEWPRRIPLTEQTAEEIWFRVRREWNDLREKAPSLKEGSDALGEFPPYEKYNTVEQRLNLCRKIVDRLRDAKTHPKYFLMVAARNMMRDHLIPRLESIL